MPYTNKINNHGSVYGLGNPGADPLGGTQSFSGADYKAVVFIPISIKKLEQEKVKVEAAINEYEKEYDELQGKFKEKSDLLIEYQSLYDTELNPTTKAYYLSWLEQTRNELLTISPTRLTWLKNIIEYSYQELEMMEDGLGSKNGPYIRPIVLGDLQTISISIHRDKFPVRTFGRNYPKSWVRGQRTIAGSLIFTIINKTALYDLLEASLNIYNTGVYESNGEGSYPEMTTVLADQLPPFDITILAANEVGDISYMAIYGVEIVNEGQTMSIQDLLTENVMQFVARDYDPLRPLTDRRRILDKGQEASQITASELSRNSLYRRDRRLDPFI